MIAQGSYECVDLAARADEAVRINQDYLRSLEEKYIRRCKWRLDNGVRTIGWCGFGRAGKDTSAEYYCNHVGIVYPGSCSSLMVPLVAQAVDRDMAAVWAERHDHRKFWVEFCNAFRRHDPTRLLRMTLAAGDVSVGIRGRLELEEGLRSGVIDYAVWIDNNRVAADFTVEYGPQDCDMVIPNHGGILELYYKIDRFVAITQASGYVLRLQRGEATPFEE